MNHSTNFSRVKANYDMGFWTEMMVRNAVSKAWITADEYTEITGQKY